MIYIYNKIVKFLEQNYRLCIFPVENTEFILYTLGDKKDRNYVIFKNGLTTSSDLSKVCYFIDRVANTGIKSASYLFIAFTEDDWDKDSYTAFNGSAFLHVLTYNLKSNTFLWDKKFYYWGSKKIKQVFKKIIELT